MPIEQAGVDVTVKAFFVESKVGKTGLTVTVDVYNPAGSKVVSDASATEVGGGLYTYTILGSSIPTTAGEWVAIFKTATTSVDVQHIPTIWVVGRVAEDVADVETKVDTAQADLDILTGTDGATLATSQPNYAPATAAALATAQNDLDTITGSDGVTLATTQGNYAPATAAQATAIETDTQDIQGRIPAALVGGRIDANAGAISGDATAADNLEAALDGTGGVTITAGLTGNVTGNLSGSVGSVTGAVGSVTGNVGGNVVGSVASVTGAVGSVTGNVGGDVVGSVNGNVDGTVASVVGGVGGNVGGSVASVTGGINTGAGTITTLDALDTAQDSQHATTQAATTSILAKLLAYFRLLLRSDAGPTTDDATELTAINADGGSGGGNYDPTTDSVEAVRDHIGDGTNLTEAGGDGDHLTEAGGTGDHLTAVPWNASWDAEVQSEVQDAIEANHLDHLLAQTYDPASKPGASDALLNEMVENDGGVSRFTANALEQASAASVDEDAIADAVIAGIGTNNPITIVSPVSGGNRITIYRGADYNGSDLDIIVPGTHDLTSATSVTFTGGGLEESLSVQSSGGTTQTVRMTLTAAETAALKKVEGGYWQIVAVLSSGYTKFISEGTINIRGNV